MIAALPVLTEPQFDLWWTAVMVAVETAWAALLLWPFITDYRQACRSAGLMAVADAVFGPDMERIP